MSPSGIRWDVLFMIGGLAVCVLLQSYTVTKLKRELKMHLLDHEINVPSSNEKEAEI